LHSNKIETIETPGIDTGPVELEAGTGEETVAACVHGLDGGVGEGCQNADGRVRGIGGVERGSRVCHRGVSGRRNLCGWSSGGSDDHANKGNGVGEDGFEVHCGFEDLLVGCLMSIDLDARLPLYVFL
jgi:hypothetical protein